MNNKPLFIEYDLKDNTSRRTFSQGKIAFKNALVISISLQGPTITGEIQESESAIYHTRLHTENGKITANCTCPHNWEPICRHAVALGLAYLNKVNHINIISEKNEEENDLEEIIPQENLFLNSIINTIQTYEKHKEKAALIIHIDEKGKRFSIYFYDKETKEIIHTPDWYLSEKDNEKNMLQCQRTFIEYFTQLETIKFFIPSRYFPLEKYLYTIPLMFSNLKFYNKDNGKQIGFAQSPLSLGLQVSLKDSHYLKIVPFWHNQHIRFNLDEGLHIKGIKSFVMHNNIFYPIISDFIEDIAFQLLLNKNPEFYSNEIPKILHEILPGFENKGIQVIKEAELENISLVSEHPSPLLKLASEEDSLKAKLFFNYGNYQLESNPNLAEKYFYITENSRLIYVMRDINKEQECGQMLIKSGFEYGGKNLYFSYKDKALDFVNKVVPDIEKTWTIINENLSQHTVSKNKIQMIIECNCCTDRANFELDFSFKAGNAKINYKNLKKNINEKKKYFLLKNNTYAEIPLDAINHLLSTLKKLNAEKILETKFLLPMYQGYYIYHEFRENINANREFFDFVNKLNNFQDIPPVPIPNEINEILRDYQKSGYHWLNFLKDNNLSGILADDMGLGKTIQTLALLQHEYIENNTTLKSIIIAPTSTIFNWEKELAKFAPKLKVCIYTGNLRKKSIHQLNNYHLILTSYTILRKDFDEISDEKFNYCILDEAQYIKNFRSQTAKTIKKINARHRLALTGTPLENNLSELWSIFDFLMPKYLFSYEIFKKTYETPILNSGSQLVANSLKKRTNPFVLRRLKEKVALELPPKVENFLYCELYEEQQAIYNQYLDAIRNNIYTLIEKDGIEKNHISILSALMRLRQICCHPKLIKDNIATKQQISSKFDYFKEIVTEIISEKHKILIFSQFVEMLDIIKLWLIKQNIPYEYLTGSIKDRRKPVESFNNNPDIPIFLISLKAGGVGLNLTSADYVIHYDPWWNPAAEAQATDRTHRIGQTKKIFSYKMITKNTIEEKILQLQDKKRNLINNVITSEMGFAKSLNRTDLDYLLSF
ncbi:MAG: hypothetical protein DKM50_02510 [Candidatus Margulisiibacteriota bacterium]|nr:MAG: hypothetical protein A2X43_03715 [Candidatus Margulisbacteria bacterium GWD2_39_127]OGI02479.1 MAG: hypothetical protein A2X42_07330 [Candidatus Margulisbacteria bacterium GWF2_38_17]OGI10972.1 MAG: hypothetical protein A2X41_01855 [Candidatus Margulisbacteria bacterium GWE2_39_32]PZM83167.1 MAG: hypothetical protein DKM50_02510 [Candidatus Margulisiibacteriota bacterium]HAR62531.1 hypothetical protein [Candidatus Margulisiibacteriota bacterium]